ncbi:LAMI_0C07448g1_1 [Lachancea mirantina]|uniref:Alkyl transferase n=1 Tax=Lachancea mirantina TaxID=1230905 RepID=A0A1G4J4H4_9SACH|nr:LAMI_0C07448g1_1 [Lachancea mirantina]
MIDSSGFPGVLGVLEIAKNAFAHIIRASDCVPQHVAFIMDGNRRWAKKQHIEIREGHNAGFQSMSRVLELCYESGVKTATVFAFSIENFKRTPTEIEWLMNLTRNGIRQVIQNGEMAEKYGIKINVIGDKALLPLDVQKDIQKAELLTKDNHRAVLNICFPYTGRHELLKSIKEVIERVDEGEMDLDQVDEEAISNHLYTGTLPPVDLLIRTSGVYRLSDFLMWQVSRKGVIIEFLDCLWPDFGIRKMAWILLKFAYSKSFSYRDLNAEDGQDIEQAAVKKKVT